jgi:hypothetical protein
VVGIVRQVDRIVAIDEDAMRTLEHPFAPRVEEASVFVEHNDRMLAATENVDLIARIDSDAGNFDERPAVWELLPALDHLDLKFVRTIGHVGLSSSHQRLDES